MLTLVIDLIDDHLDQNRGEQSVLRRQASSFRRTSASSRPKALKCGGRTGSVGVEQQAPAWNECGTPRTEDLQSSYSSITPVSTKCREKSREFRKTQRLPRDDFAISADGCATWVSPPQATELAGDNDVEIETKARSNSAVVGVCPYSVHQPSATAAPQDEVRGNVREICCCLNDHDIAKLELLLLASRRSSADTREPDLWGAMPR